MAKQTKHLIALSDVKAAVLDCKHCGSNVSFPFARNRRIPASCPVCSGDWDRTLSSTHSDSIGKFMALQRGLREALEGPHQSTVGYAMSLEINIEEPISQSTSSAHTNKLTS
jgi:hypothetical protein